MSEMLPTLIVVAVTPLSVPPPFVFAVALH